MERSLIIVSGRIHVRPGSRDEFLRRSAGAIAQARGTSGCRDFVVAADPLEPDRVNVYEEWESEDALSAFRGGGPGEDLSAMIVRADVREHVVPMPDVT